MSERRIELLAGMPVFGGVTKEILVTLLERIKSVNVTKGDLFFKEGDRDASAFVLEQGRVSIFKTWEGNTYFLRHLETGDCFGEVALMDFGPRSASVRADVDCSALEISARDLRHVANQSLEMFAMIYMNIGRELSRRLRAADERAFQARVQVGDLEAAIHGL